LGISFGVATTIIFPAAGSRRLLEDPGGENTDALCVHPAQHGHMDMQDFRRALGAVPAEQRKALILVTAAGLSYDEAAAIAGCATGTMKSRVHRARCRLIELLNMADTGEFGPDPTAQAIVMHSSTQVAGRVSNK